MLAHHAKGVPFNLFTLSDLHYRNGDKVQMNYKGLVGTNPDQTVSHVKPAYSAAQNVFTLFDHTLVGVTNFTCQASVTNALAAFAYTNQTSGAAVVVLWFRGSPPVEANATLPVNLTFTGVRFTEPVYADLRTGKVYALPRGDSAASFQQVPLYDSPIVIAEKAALPLEPEPHADDARPDSLPPGPTARRAPWAVGRGGPGQTIARPRALKRPPELEAKARQALKTSNRQTSPLPGQVIV